MEDIKEFFKEVDDGFTIFVVEQRFAVGARSKSLSLRRMIMTGLSMLSLCSEIIWLMYFWNLTIKFCLRMYTEMLISLTIFHSKKKWKQWSMHILFFP